MGKYKYTCAHCKTGMVTRLPAVCPECERLLTKEVEKTSAKVKRKKITEIK